MTNDQKTNRNGCMDIKPQLQQKESSTIPFKKSRTQEMYQLVEKDINVWCNLHSLSVRRAYCSECGTALTMNIPITTKKKENGLACPPCKKCGNEITPFYHQLKDKELVSILRKFRVSFKALKKKKKVLNLQ